MNTLSDRLNRLAPSATLAMSQRSSELKAQGVDVINMSVGEPDFNTPDHIKAAAIKAVEDNWSRYSPVPGYPELKKAIVNKLKNENGLDYAPSQILCSNGAKQSVCNTIMALVNAGDEVIIPAPYWVSYPQMVLLAEGTPVFVEATIEQDFKITPAQLEAAITPKTKALILCSPSNPTGSVYSKAELEALKNVLLKYPNVIVVADEIYEHINYVGEHASMAQFADIKDRVVIINQGKVAAIDTITDLSSKLSGSTKLSLSFKGPVKEVTNKLRSIPGVNNVTSIVSNDDTSIHQVEITADSSAKNDVRTGVFYAMSKGGWPMLEFRSMDPSLEEIFLSITSV